VLPADDGEVLVAPFGQCFWSCSYRLCGSARGAGVDRLGIGDGGRDSSRARLLLGLSVSHHGK